MYRTYSNGVNDMNGKDNLEEDFQALDYTNNSHPDISLAVFFAKRIEFVIRKYFCGLWERNCRVTLGPLIKDHSSVRFRCPDVVYLLQLLVAKRNELIHNVTVNKFQSKSERRKFVENSNLVLTELKKVVPSREMQLQSQIGSLEDTVRGQGPEAKLQRATSFVLKVPSEDSSTKELIDFHCWDMVKNDPSLQQYIAEDVDGLFKGLLPMKLEDYVSLVPSS